MKSLLLFFLIGISPLYHPMERVKSEILGFLFNAVDNEGREYGVTFGFFRGKFLAFSLKANLVGMIYYQLDYTDYEAAPFLRGLKEEGTKVWYKNSYIEVNPENISVHMKTKNYVLDMNVVPERRACERMIKSDFKGEFYLLVFPVTVTGKFNHIGHLSTRVKGRGFTVRLWSDSSIKIKDYLLFNSEKTSGFFEIDVPSKKAKGFLCRKGIVEKREFTFRINEKGRGILTERLYPLRGTLEGEEKLNFRIRSLKDEVKMFRYSYLLSPIEVTIDGEKGRGFLIFHPLKEVSEKEKWEF